jgi:calpain
LSKKNVKFNLGIEETYNLKELQDKNGFFDIIGNALAHDAMMGSSINADPSVKEAKLSNGLVKGHAYAITAVVTLNVNGQYVRLVRCRNPWGKLSIALTIHLDYSKFKHFFLLGNEVEWNGRWSDGDPSWNQVPSQDRQQLGQTSRADGEFWLSYEDWVNNFDQIQICNLSPDTLKAVRGSQGSKWNCIQFDGELVPGRSAGGSGQPDRQKFWTNPQYLVRLDHADENATDCVLIIAFMQKYTRQKRMQNRGEQAEEFLQLRIFRVNDHVDVSIFQNGSGEKLYPKDLERIGTTGPYINSREVCFLFFWC